MAAYNGPVWQSMADSDKRGEFAADGGKAMAAGISQAGQAFGDRLKEMASEKDKAEGLDLAYELMAPQIPDLPAEFADKFHKSGTSAKANLFSTMMAMLHRSDQQGQQKQQYGLDERRISVAEGELEHRKAPRAPKFMPDPRDASAPPLAYNEGTGNLMDLPPLPNDDGAAVHELPGTNYGVGTFNGKPVTGAIPFNYGKPNEQGFKLAPVQGTDLAIPVGPDGKPVAGMKPFQRKAPSGVGGFLKSLIGNPDYEPAPAPPAAGGRDQIMSGPEGTFAKRADGSTYVLEDDEDGSRRWAKIPGFLDERDGPAANLFPDGNLLNPQPNPAAAGKPVARPW